LQQTLYEMGKAVLEALPEVAEIRFSMPNNHHFLVDLSPFGLDNPNEVFFAADRPYAKTEAAVERDAAPDAGDAWKHVPGLVYNSAPRGCDSSVTSYDGGPRTTRAAPFLLPPREQEATPRPVPRDGPPAPGVPENGTPRADASSTGPAPEKPVAPAGGPSTAKAGIWPCRTVRPRRTRPHRTPPPPSVPRTKSCRHGCCSSTGSNTS